MDPQTTMLTIILLLMMFYILRFALNLASNTMSAAFNFVMPNVEAFQPVDKRAKDFNKLYHKLFVQAAGHLMVGEEIRIAAHAAQKALQNKNFRKALPGYKKAIQRIKQLVWDRKIHPKIQTLANRLNKYSSDKGFAAFRNQKGITSDKIKDMFRKYSEKMKEEKKALDNGEVDEAIRDTEEAVDAFKPLKECWEEYEGIK